MLEVKRKLIGKLLSSWQIPAVSADVRRPVRRRLALAALFVLLLAVRGLADPLTFRRAVELASQKAAANALISAERQKSRLRGSFLRSARRAFARPAPGTMLQAAPGALDGRPQILLEAALAYAELASVNLRIAALQKQKRLAARVLDIESLRVANEVDDPILLIRAKLAAARTNERVAVLDACASHLRLQLANLTGLDKKEIETSSNSMPLLPYTPHDQDAITPNTPYFGVELPTSTSGPARPMSARQDDVGVVHSCTQAFASEAVGEDAQPAASIEELRFAKDVAQLEYVVAHTESAKISAQTELGQASPGSQALAQIKESEKFDDLLSALLRFRTAQLRLLQATGELELWAFGRDLPALQVFRATTTRKISFHPGNSVSLGSREPAPVTSMMIAPAVPALVVGQSRQLSAILISADGSARVATSEVLWRTSTNWEAIVSTSGFVTALSPGMVTFTASVSGVSDSWAITIKPEDSSLGTQ